MRRIQGLAAVVAVAALAGGGAVAAASVGGAGNGTGTTTTGTTTTPAPKDRAHGGPGLRGFGGGYGLFDAATTTALDETFAAVETARKTATDAGKSPDEIRDAAIAAAKARLDKAVADGALTKAQGASVLTALTSQLSAKAAVIDALAGVLKLTPTELAKRLAAGDRLDEIATAQGVDLQAVTAAIEKARGANGTLGPLFGRGHRDHGLGGLGGRGFGGKGHKDGKDPTAPTQAQPSTQSGSFSGKGATAHI